MTTQIHIEENVHAEIVKMLNAGESLGKIEGMLKFLHDYTTNGAKAAVAEVREELGIQGGGHTTADWSDTVAYLRAKYGTIGKKELIQGMCEINGKTYATNNHAYNYIAMAQEWASQELAK